MQSYTGVELLRVLIANECKPILMIAFTNHALDHMLSAVLDAKITSSVVRLGSRSADQRIAEYSLENQEKLAGKSRLDRAFGHNYRDLKQVEEELRDAMEELLRVEVRTEQILKHLAVDFPEEHDYLTTNPPPWVEPLHRTRIEDDGEGEWHRAGRNGRNVAIDRSLYAFWQEGHDIQFLLPREQPILHSPPVQAKAASKLTHQNPFGILSHQKGTEGPSTVDGTEPSQSEDDLSDDSDEEAEATEDWRKVIARARHQTTTLSPPRARSVQVQPEAPKTPPSETSSDDPAIALADLQNPLEYFRAMGYERIPLIPTGTRTLEELRVEADPWQCSPWERQTLHAAWTQQVKTKLAESEQETFEHLRKKHADILERYNEGKNEVSTSLGTPSC